MKEPLAIVGMACRLPGADGIDAFWKLVLEGRTAWGPLPESRLPRDLYFHPEKSRLGKSYSELGGIVSDRPVDPTACPITPELRERYDVAHAIFLEVASLACRDAGLDPFAMPADRRTGVYVGHTGGSTKIGDIVYATGIDETATLLSEVDAARVLLGADVESVAAEVTAAVRRRYPGREPGESLDLGALGAAKIVQEALRLDGPFLVVDAACASSLQALAIGARALLQGGIDQAIVGGASYCKSDSLVLFSAAQSVSNAGSCPFGEAADGLVTAEGYVALVVKTLSRALADGDRIRAVIRGLGVASDGKGKSLWAPRQEGQILAVERAYPDIADLGRIEYIEAHATSTQVGDATELGALSSLLAKHLPAGRKIPIGSVKANIGHTLETAGIASLVKVVLSMQHGAIPPGSTCAELNSGFDWNGGPFSVPRSAIPWPPHADGSPRFAAVNAFGIGGLNVHIALAEPVKVVLAPPRSAGRREACADAEAIAVVGTGCVLPGAATLEAFCDLLDRGGSGIGPVPGDRWNAARVLDASAPRAWHTMSDIGGFVRDFAYDWRRHKVPPKQIAAANPLQFMLLEAADAAILDAGGPQAGLDRRRTAVVVGTLFGGDFANQLQMGLRLPETGVYLRAALVRRGVPAAEIDRVVALYEKKVLERLPALVDETGSFTSSTLASRLTKTFDLMGGALALDAGDCSSLAAISAAVDMLREGNCDAVLCAAGERCMDLMAYEGRSLGRFLSPRPVSVLDGHTRGGDVPAEGAVVFVLKRLADARAAGNRIRAVIRGVCVGSAHSHSEAIRRVVREGAEKSGVAALAVQAVECAVAGGHDKTGDELAVVGGHYGRATDAGRPVVAGALDGQIGHAGAAAGAAAIVKLSHALATGTMPATVALQSGRVERHGLVAASAACPLGTADAGGYRAGSVTVIQERQVGHLVLDNGLPLPETARPRAGGITSVRGARAGGTPSQRPLVAALFPGQGSQYTDMFRGLVEESAEARACLERLDALARDAGRETLAEIAWRPVNGLGTRIWDTQWAMYLGDMLAWDVLREMGFSPDCIASHSFGEFPSLVAAGAWSLVDGGRATRARADAVEFFGPRDGAMVSVIADRAAVAAAIAPFAGQVWICAENAPEQFVVGGTARLVDAVEEALDAHRIRWKRLAVPSPFHTPLLEAAAGRLAAALQPLSITAPRITTYSSTSAARLESAADIHESLIRQMTETVRWVATIERLHAAGVRTFVEVGPSGVLTGLSRRILEGREGVTFLQFDQRSRAAGAHLARLREQLAAAGALAAGHGGAFTAAGDGAETPPPAPSRALDAAASRPRHDPEPESAAVAAGRVTRFDATSRRRDRNRSGAALPRAGQVPARTVDAGSPAREASPARAEAGGNGHDGRHAAAMTASRRSDTTAAVLGTDLGHVAPAPLRAEASAGLLTAGRPARESEMASTGDPEPHREGNLEEVVAALLAEAGATLPLARAGRAAEEFLESASHLFALRAAERPRVLEAASLGALCDLLERAGGKSEWVGRSPEVQVSGGGIETFLIDFVVEQTGYPREIVELDADLEGDLGIDSIRKAQLFGEIGQRYGLGVDESVSLDDFTTLRHLLDYMLPRVGGGASRPAGDPAAHVTSSSAVSANGVATPVPSAAFERGARMGREHAAAIRLWARQVAVESREGVPHSVDATTGDELEGVAAAAGVDPAIVRVASADPAAALGGCDALLAASRSASGVDGLVVCFGRGADPLARGFQTAAARGVLVGVKGLSGAVAGWNDAGLMAVVGRGQPGAAAVVESLLTGCRTVAEVERMLRGLPRPPVGLLIAAAGAGGFTVSDTAALVPAGDVIDRVTPRSPLERVILGDRSIAADAAIASLVGEPGVAERSAVSATCVWMAVGAADDGAVARSGGPSGRDWIAESLGAATGVHGEAWLEAARRRRTPARDTARAARALDASAASAAGSSEITRRYTIAVEEAGPARAVRSLRGERVLILAADDVAGSLARVLESHGAKPIVAAPASADEAMTAVERAEEGGAVRHLIVATTRTDRAASWLAQSGAAVEAPFFACQRWLTLRGRAGDLEAATLTAVTRLGGDFGLSGHIDSVAGGALAGLFKGIAREFPAVHVRVVDVPEGLADADGAAGVVAELCDGDGPVEIGLREGRRLAVVAVEGRPSAATRLGAVEAGSVWIVTGGARGVTAACCRELAGRHRLRLVLVGSTVPVAVETAWLALDEAGVRELKSRVMLDAKGRGADPRSAWRAVEKSIEISRSIGRLRDDGIDVRYEPCDLADADAVRSLVARVVRDLGPVRGIVHGAGFEAACRFEKKTREGLAATLGPKCAGLEHLLAAVDPKRLEAVIGFGSTSGRLGGHGQADYSLANELLAKILGRVRARNPGVRSTVFHWHAWDEVGMASRPESRFVLEQFGLRFMPLAEGVRRFMDEIEAGLPDTEVLVTEPAMCPEARKAVEEPGGPAAAGTRGHAAKGTGDLGSLVATVDQRRDGTSVAFRLDPQADRFLVDHLQYGRPLLPAVMGAEILVQAVRAVVGGAAVGEIRDFVVERPVAFPTDNPRDLRVEVVAADAGPVEARGWSQVLSADGRNVGEERVHVRGVVVPGPAEPVTLAVSQPPFPFNPMYYQEDAPLRHGPSFRTLDGLFLDRSGGWGRLVSQHGDGVTWPRGPKGWTIPVALLDGCIVACAVYSYILCGRRVEVPVRFERVRVLAQPRGGEKCIARMLFRSQDARESIYDVVLFGDDGRAIMALDGLHLAVLGGERNA